MLSQVRARCATTPCATLFFPQLPAVAAAHGDVQPLRVQAEEGLLLMQSRAHERIAGVGGQVGTGERVGGEAFALHAKAAESIGHVQFLMIGDDAAASCRCALGLIRECLPLPSVHQF